MNSGGAVVYEPVGAAVPDGTGVTGYPVPDGTTEGYGALLVGYGGSEGAALPGAEGVCTPPAGTVTVSVTVTMVEEQTSSMAFVSDEKRGTTRRGEGAYRRCQQRRRR